MPARPTLPLWQLARLATLLLVLASLPAPAQTTAELHAAEATLDGAGDRAMAAAFAEALGKVLVRLTGRRDAAADAGLRQLVGDPAALVQQYRLAEGGRVRVQFDATALRRRLDAADLPVWGEARPLTLVWVVAPGADGLPELLEAPRPEATPLASAQPRGMAEPVVPGSEGPDLDPPPLAERVPVVLAEVGAERGLMLVQPLLDFQDLATVSAVDLAAGVLDALPEAARRYAAEAVLVGQVMSPVAGNEQLRWTLLIGDDQLEWVGQLAEGPHGLADRLAQRLATTRSGLQSLRLLVGDVSSLEGWGRLNVYLSTLGIIESHRVERVAGDRMLLALEVRGDVERLVRTLSLRRVLEPMPAEASADEADLVYRLVGWP